MRVLVLTQYYYPEPVPKPSDLAEAFAKRGHQVTAVTGFPNYPAGKVYPGFRLRLLKKEKVAGVSVIRTFVFPYHGHSAVGRILNHVSFSVSAVVGALLSHSCDIIYVFHPPLTIGLTAWLIGLIKGAPFIYDVQDIWPESLTAAGKLSNSLIIWLMHQIERFIYWRARHLLVLTPAAKRNLVGKGVSDDKITVGGFWVDETRFLDNDRDNGPGVRQRYGIGNRFLVMYAGNMGYLQGLDTVLSCAEKLRNHDGIVFLLVGDGVDREGLMSRAKEASLANVVFVESQPVAMIPAFLSAADVLLVHLRNSQLYELVIPGKTLSYLASGRAIIMAMNGDGADLIRQANAGIVIPPEDPDAMADAVLRLSRLSNFERIRMGENGRSYLLAHFSKDKVMGHYEDIFKRACGYGIQL